MSHWKVIVKGIGAYLPGEPVPVKDIDAYIGKIPSAAIYVAMNQLYEEQKLKKGTLLLLPSIEGATWGWGATVLRWHGAGQKTPANASQA